MNLKFYFSVGLMVISLLSFVFREESWIPPWTSIYCLIGSCGSFVLFLKDLGIRNFRLWYRLYRDGIPIRVSMAYLITIHFNGKYLLVKNSNGRYFQLPGGKFKFYEKAANFIKSLSVQPDMLDRKPRRERDLAIFLSPMDLIKFLRWFDKKNDREVSPVREFQEEIVEPLGLEEFLPAKDASIFSFSNRIRTPLRFVQYGQNYEQMTLDVFSLDVSNDQLEKLFQKTQNKSQFYWASREQMISGRLNPTDDRDEIGINKPARWVVIGKVSDQGT